MPVATPASSTGNFLQSVTGGDTPSPSGVGIGGRLSPYAFNTNGTADAAYSVLGAGPNPPNSPNGTATYNINAPAAELLWGSPDPYNSVEFFSGPNDSGMSLGTFTGSDLGCFNSTCNATLSSLVTFTAASGDIGSIMLSNAGSAAFEFGGPDPVPLPPAIYLFGSALGGAFWLGRKKRSAVSSLSS